MASSGWSLDDVLPSEEELAWQQDMDRRLLRLRDELGPTIGSVYDRFAKRLCFGSFPGYFLHPLALPILHLPAWCARAAQRRGRTLSEQAVSDLIASCGMGYLKVRIQDDWMDERRGDPDASMMLAEVFFARHVHLIARYVGDHSPFWSRFDSCWFAYQEAMLHERSLHQARSGYDRAAFDRVLLRSQPLVLPGAAVLCCAGLWDLTADLERFVVHLARAHQLFHDLVDAEKDLQNDNYTYVLQRFSGGEGVDHLREQLFIRGGFDAIVAEVQADLQQAHRCAERIGLLEAIDYVQSRRESVSHVQQEVFRALFMRMLGRSS